MPKEPLALISADWHVRKLDRTWYRRDEIYGDCGYSISQINNIADEYDVPNVFLAGDLFDTKMQQSDALRTMRLSLDRFQEQNRRVFYTQGQHERSAPPILSAMHPWPDYIHKSTIERGGLRFYGLDYCNPGDVQAELEAVPRHADILVTHQVWKDFLGEKHGDAWLRWAPNMRLLITGDYHSSFVRTVDDQLVLSPGSINMQDIGEEPVKYVYILFDDLSIERAQLKTRLRFEVTLNTTEDVDRFVDTWATNPARILQPGVPPNIAVNLLRVRYRADVPEARQRIEATVGTSAHLFLDTIRVQSPDQVSVEQERRLNAIMQGGLEGCIAEFYSDNTRVRDNAMRLARTTNIQTELLSIFQGLIHEHDRNREGTLPAPPV
jgi:predicted phosphodiesterase